MISIYKRFIGRFIFRKLNLGIGISLLLVFILLGILNYGSFYRLLEQREQELLDIRTEKLVLHLQDAIDRFKRETVSIYRDKENDQQIGTNEYFLPANVPAADDKRMQLHEKTYFSGVISMMLNRNPIASAFAFFRLEDRKTFLQTREQQLQVNSSFDLTSFFTSLPRDYDYPYIGKADGFLVTSRPMIYFANPVFDFSSIRPNKVFGYYAMIVDADAVVEEFNSSHNQENGRLVIKQSGNVLLNTSPDGSEVDMDTGHDLTTRIMLDQYGLEISTAKSKNTIQSKLTEIMLFTILILGLAWPVCMLLIYSIQRIIVNRLKLMSQQFKKVQTNPFTEPIPVQGEDEISDLIFRFNRMTAELQQYINRVYVTDIQKRNAEYVALKMQINPHFLFNTLESLRMQAVISGQPIISEKLYNMGKLFRWMLKSDGDAIPVNEELQYVEYYLDLFNMGKSNTIRLDVDSPLDLNDCYMLKFSLQPIVENAILHGELEKADDPTITLRITHEGGFLLVDIHNNGTGIDPGKMEQLIAKLASPQYLPEEHLGLKNIHERIRNYFGEQHGLFLETTASADCFRILMKLPFDSGKYEVTEA